MKVQAHATVQAQIHCALITEVTTDMPLMHRLGKIVGSPSKSIDKHVNNINWIVTRGCHVAKPGDTNVIPTQLYIVDPTANEAPTS